MVYGILNELVTGAYKPTNITGRPHIDPHCMYVYLIYSWLDLAKFSLQGTIRPPACAGLNYTIQLAPFDCTGCAVCVE